MNEILILNKLLKNLEKEIFFYLILNSYSILKKITIINMAE